MKILIIAGLVLVTMFGTASGQKYPEHDNYCEIYVGTAIVAIKPEGCYETIDYYLLQGWHITQYGSCCYVGNDFVLEKK